MKGAHKTQLPTMRRCGAENIVDHKYNYVSTNSLDPTNIAMPSHVVDDGDDDDITVVTMSNTKTSWTKTYAIAATTQATVIDKKVDSGNICDGGRPC